MKERRLKHPQIALKYNTEQRIAYKLYKEGKLSKKIN